MQLCSFLCDEPGDADETDVCLLYVSYSECAEINFIMDESTSPVKQQERGASLTVLPEFLEFYLLLYSFYSLRCFHMQINAFSSSTFIYCKFLGLECCRLPQSQPAYPK
jgi:hypothetical protein